MLLKSFYLLHNFLGYTGAAHLLKISLTLEDATEKLHNHMTSILGEMVNLQKVN